MLDLIKNFGRCPAEYDPKIHGRYNPAYYYGKPDTPFLDLKIGDIGAWFSRRQKSPQRLIAMCSRAFWRWNMYYTQPKQAGIAPFFQIVVTTMIVFYCLNYQRIKQHKNYKYH